MFQVIQEVYVTIPEVKETVRQSDVLLTIVKIFDLLGLAVDAGRAYEDIRHEEIDRRDCIFPVLVDFGTDERTGIAAKSSNVIIRILNPGIIDFEHIERFVDIWFVGILL